MMKAVIIVSLYKAEAFLDDLFGSLERHYNECGWVKVVAVDDRSPDQSFELVRERYSWVDLIQTQKNFGFAKANNFATEYALKKYNPEFLFYLNQDTEVEEGFLEKLVDVLEKDPSIGIVQPLLMIHPFEQGIVNSAGCRLHYLGYGFTRDEGKRINQQLTVNNQQGIRTESIDIAYASGAAFMIRSAIVKKIGVFDPHCVAYHEDTDLSLRVWKTGFRVVLCPESRVAHKYTTPSQVKEKKQANHNAYYWIERNRFILYAKFYTARMMALFFPAFMMNEIGVMIFSLFRGFWKERLRMYWWLGTHLGELKKIRQDSKRDKDWEQKLMGLFSTEIWHGNADSAVLGLANIFWKTYFWIASLFIKDTTKIHDREYL